MQRTSIPQAAHLPGMERAPRCLGTLPHSCFVQSCGRRHRNLCLMATFLINHFCKIMITLYCISLFFLGCYDGVDLLCCISSICLCTVMLFLQPILDAESWRDLCCLSGIFFVDQRTVLCTNGPARGSFHPAP